MTTNAPRNNRKISNVIPPPPPPPKKTGNEEIIGRIRELSKMIREQDNKPIYFTQTTCSNCSERLCLKHGKIENENGIEIDIECENCKQTNKFVIFKRTNKESLGIHER